MSKSLTGNINKNKNSSNTLININGSDTTTKTTNTTTTKKTKTTTKTTTVSSLYNSIFACQACGFAVDDEDINSTVSPTDTNINPTDIDINNKNSGLHLRSLQENNEDRTGIMMRASVSRRKHHHQQQQQNYHHDQDGTVPKPPVMRSRSSERLDFTSSSHNDNNDSDNYQNGQGTTTLPDDIPINLQNMNLNDYTTTSNASEQSSDQKGHRRAMSDPFDAQQQEDSAFFDAIQNDGMMDDHLNAGQGKDSAGSNNNSNDEDDKYDDWELEDGGGGSQRSHHNVVPTLPRYPVQETRNKNCWSTPPISIFSVRGAGYLSDKKKIKSGPYLLETRGCDMFLADNNHHPFNLHNKTRYIFGGQLRTKPTVAIDFCFPWGYINLYFEIPPHLAPYVGAGGHDAAAASTNGQRSIDQTLSPSEKLLARWLMGTDDFRNERLKLIAYVAEGPWVVRNMVTGRPALIGKKLPVKYHVDVPTTKSNTTNSKRRMPEPLLTATLDIGNSSATAKRIVSVCRRYMSALTVDIGFVIQGDADNELPEQMMGAVRIHGADPLRAQTLS